MKKTAKTALTLLCAAMLTAGIVTAPVYAAEDAKHYVLGDVDMDGKVTEKDGLIVLQEYTHVTLFGLDRSIEGEQFALAKAYDPDRTDISLLDALGILLYYTRKTLEGDNTVNWKTLRGEEFFTTRIAAIDRGDYTLAFDEAVGDYVIVKKG